MSEWRLKWEYSFGGRKSSYKEIKKKGISERRERIINLLLKADSEEKSFEEASREILKMFPKY